MSTYLDLNTGLTEEEVALKDSVHKFAKEVLRPASIELDKLNDPEDVIKKDSVLWDVFKKAYDLGYHKTGFPEELGGQSLSPIASHIFAEEMGWGSAGLSVTLGVTSFPFSFAALLGDDEVKQQIAVPFLEDEEAKYVGCWAVTEPDHGSDAVMGMTPKMLDPKVTFQVQAKLDGDEWVINGQKSSWVSNGTIATHALTHLTIDPSMGMVGGGIAVIPLDLPGVSKGKALDKLGQRDLNQGEIFFDDVRIPKKYMLIDQNMYSFTIDMILAGANAGMGSTFTGVARAAFEEALAYCKERVQGGKPICDHQLVQHKLFEMFTKVESARALSRAAALYNAHLMANMMPPQTQYSIASKIHCTRIAVEVACDAIQLHGGYGLSKEYLVEKLYRDARASLIEDGNNEVLALAGAHLILERY